VPGSETGVRVVIREIKSLTGLRGIAALWVVACHWSGSELSGVVRDIALHGYVAVDLFMVLSGFVLALTFVPERSYGRFVVQRLCRLYPLYALATLVCMIEQWWAGTGVFASDGEAVLPAVLSNFLLTTTNLWEVDAFDGPSWVVTVEFGLNLLLPMFVLLCLRTSDRLCIVVAAGCAIVLTVVSLLNHRLDGGVLGELGTLDTRLMYFRCGPEFALGMLSWRFWRRWNRPAPLLPVVAAMLAMTPFKALDLPFVAATCVLIVGLASDKGWIAAMLGSPMPRWLGTISYSLYLWHIAFLPPRPVLILWLPDIGAPLAFANTVNLALVLGFSTLSYRWFELPVSRTLRRAFPS